MSLKSIRSYKALKPLMKLRDGFMEKTGLFKVKARIKQRLFLKKIVKEDKAKKLAIYNQVFALPDSRIVGANPGNGIIVSVTSYGKRVIDTLPYMLYSLLQQSLLPERIVVWLDWDNWDDSKLPLLLVKMKGLGVEFRYCEDLKSYKKLIPSLEAFPDNPIVTLDDDFYYHHDYIKWITEAYDKSDKMTVLGQWGCIPEKSDGKYVPYNEWKDCKYGDEISPVSFFGCGCCYPPYIFDDEIKKKAIFMKLCPTADDIWFWAMEERQNIKRQYILQKGNGYHTSVNRIEEYDWSLDCTLMHQNVVVGRNNAQLDAVVAYYGLD